MRQIYADRCMRIISRYARALLLFISLAVPAAAAQAGALQGFRERQAAPVPGSADIGHVFADEVYPAVPNPWAVAASDLNGDGAADLAVTSYVGTTVSILLGSGDGTFMTGPVYEVGFAPFSIAIGDLNADGNKDLAVGNSLGSGTATVLLGTGTGEFSPSRSFATGGHPSSVAIGDLDGDGSQDLVVANELEGTIGVLLGLGDGTFLAPAVLDGVAAAKSVAISDLNRDGLPDLAVAAATGVAVLTGLGGGSFSAPSIQSVGRQIRTQVVSIDDMNNDGEDDIVAIVNGIGVGDCVAVLLGVGDGTFQSALTIPAECGASALALSDLDGDGIEDAAVASGGVVTIFLGTGSGFLSYSQSRPLGGVLGLASADFDGDGLGDLAASSNTSGVMIVLSREGDLSPSVRSLSTGDYPADIAVSDLNQDGALDMAVANEGNHPFSQGTVSIHLGAGDGTFFLVQQYVTGNNPKSVALSDLNNDGIMDLVASNSHSDFVSVYLGEGDGTFAVPSQIFACGSGPSHVIAADLNGDGIDDLVTANRFAADVSVLLGLGGGLFSTESRFAVGAGPVSIATLDVDRDGDLDMVVAAEGGGFGAPGSTTLLVGQGDGTFSSASDLPSAGGAPVSVAVADLNSDGLSDVAVLLRLPVPTGGEVSVHFGAGDGTFPHNDSIALEDNPNSIAISDLDGDGAEDLVVSGARVSAFFGRGDGTFEGGRFYSNSWSVLGAIEDFDMDGKPDLALAYPSGECDGVSLVHDVWVHFNQLP